MPPLLERVIALLLLGGHVGLGAWAVVGFAELALGEVPWARVSNPLFSRPMLLLQWTLVATAAVTFIVGYGTRWAPTPIAMTGIYEAMALTCAYQTFFILTAATRFRAMAIEYLAYAAILAFLFASGRFRAGGSG